MSSTSRIGGSAERERGLTAASRVGRPLDSRRDAVEIHRRTGYVSGDVALFERLTGTRHLHLVERARGPVDATWLAALEERLGAEMDRPVRFASGAGPLLPERDFVIQLRGGDRRKGASS